VKTLKAKKISYKKANLNHQKALNKLTSLAKDPNANRKVFIGITYHKNLITIQKRNKKVMSPSFKKDLYKQINSMSM
jgi:hypothetical protein